MERFAEVRSLLRRRGELISESGGKGLACVTLRDDIQRKFDEDFKKRQAGEYEKYILFCTASQIAARQKKTA